MFFYVPDPAAANQSVKEISYVVEFGWAVRGLHYWAGQAMVIFTFLHLLRVFFTGAYKPPREFNWIIGIFLFAITVFMDFTGYPLRWDTNSYWALVVGTNLLKSIPLFGQGIYKFVVGAEQVGQPALLRFYVWHCLGLPLLAFILMVYHFWRVRKDGGISNNDSF